jgi:hypothetical protein
MPESFLILLAGGTLLAAAIQDPRQVTLRWLRLAGIIALCTLGLAGYFLLTRDLQPSTTAFYHRLQLALFGITVLTTLAHLAFVQVARRNAQRVLALMAFVFAVLSGSGLLHEIAPLRPDLSKPLTIALQTLGCVGVAALTGVAIMDMLLGHAYLTASQMTMRPFSRINNALAALLAVRLVCATVVALTVNAVRPFDLLFNLYGLYIATRWLVGLIVPAVFVYMARDCINRRATQSATGILYVAGVLIFIGEITALYLIKETSLPF